MSAHRTRRRPAWDHLEDRRCPAFIGPLPAVPVSEIPAQLSDPDSVALQDLYKQEIAAWSPEVAFYGDSIAYNYGYTYGAPSWGQSIAGLDAADYGEPGDATQNILWRIENGEFPKVPPKVIVLQAGANNLGTDNEGVETTLLGIENLVNVIHGLAPTSKILVVGMIPVGAPNCPWRPDVVEINAQLAKFVNDQWSYFLDAGPSLLGDDDTLETVDEPDLVHPNPVGYQIWTQHMIGMLDQLLGIEPEPTAPPLFSGALGKNP